MALVPGRALMSELGGKMPSIRNYLLLKEQMDSPAPRRNGSTRCRFPCTRRDKFKGNEHTSKKTCATDLNIP
ncbi:hypothetical protein [Thalassovita litoralis]|uniref:hypothetical protein n=1 Tax=Thalassovita litoralis TaxID=1010611 RepID=UPI0038B4DBEB